MAPLIFYSCVHYMYTDREGPTYLHAKVDVKFCKYIFMTKYVESNRNKYGSCNINCFTLYPIFEIAAGKNIIQYKFYLIIMWVVKLVESFVGNVGANAMYQKNRD